jgi:hypothetical protein
MDITNQRKNESVTIRMSWVEFFKLQSKLKQMDRCDFTQDSLQLINSDLEKFDLNLIVEDSSD